MLGRKYKKVLDRKEDIEEPQGLEKKFSGI
jgi:hypothetical protein